jgi:FxsC-like protein
MLPEVARSIQYAHHDLGSRYSAEGFYGIIKLERYRRDYQMAVHELARRIVDVAHETQVSSEPPADYFSLESAFGSADSLGTATEMMNIAVVALDTSTLPDGRTGEYYGNTARTWNPYRPEASLPLADYAAELTTCFGCQSAVGTFDEHIARRAASGELMSPCLCLIDPWTTVSPAHQEKLQRLDALDQSWVSVLVPWNCRDAQMTAAEEDLRQGLSLSLSRKLASVPERCRLAATGIPSLREFSELLPQMAAIMLKRFRKDAPSYPPPGPVIERGRLRQADPADSGGLS